MTIGTAKARAERDDDGATAEEGVTVSQLVEASLVEASQTTPARPGPASGGGHGRRGFSAAYKLAILEEYERLDEPGAKGVLLRREGLYSSHIVEWRHARAGGPFAGLEPKVATAKRTPRTKRSRGSPARWSAWRTSSAGTRRP